MVFGGGCWAVGGGGVGVACKKAVRAFYPLFALFSSLTSTDLLVWRLLTRRTFVAAVFSPRSFAFNFSAAENSLTLPF